MTSDNYPGDEAALRYLQAHPEFFERHPDLLVSLRVPHPDGGRAIPLVERQVLTLRDRNRLVEDRNRLLENKLSELVQFGEENDTIGDRVHRLSLALLGARDHAALVGALYRNLREDFGVPAVALRLWGPDLEPGLDAVIELEKVSQGARVFVESLTAPYFSERPMFESSGWFDNGPQDLCSLVYVPLRAERSLGILVLGSPEAQRFAPDLGVLYLTRMGELSSMGLRRIVEA